MNKIISFLFVFVFAFSCQEKTTKDLAEEDSKIIELLSVEEFATHIKDKNVQLIDVRTEKEFAQGHIEKAKNFDINAKNFSDSLLSLNKNKAVYLYCRSGKRSKKATLELQKLGFQKIYDLKGGFLAWEKTTNSW